MSSLFITCRVVVNMEQTCCVSFIDLSVCTVHGTNPKLYLVTMSGSASLGRPQLTAEFTVLRRASVPGGERDSELRPQRLRATESRHRGFAAVHLLPQHSGEQPRHPRDTGNLPAHC